MNNTAQNSRFVAALKEVLQNEIALQRKYQGALKASEEAVSALNLEAVGKTDGIREELMAQMSDAAEKRRHLLNDFPEQKLTQIIEIHCLEIDKEPLLKLAKGLREAAEETKRATRNYNQILDFGGKVINGTLSILTSANQNVTRGYSSKGQSTEEFRNVKDELKKA